MIHRKRTHKDIKDPKILAIWEELLEQTKMLYPQYFQYCTPELYYDSSYAHLGYCSQSYVRSGARHVDKIRANRCIITISENLGKDYAEIRDTICHELGHFVAPSEHHSHLWEARANKIGQPWGIKVSRLGNNETFNQAAEQARAEVAKKHPYQYRLYCPDCGVEWKYKTKCDAVRRPERYLCSKCKTKLKSEKM